MERTKQKILEIVEIVLLLTLIGARIAINSDENNWISLLNYIGLLIAYVSLYLDISAECARNKKFDVFTGWFVVLLGILVFIGALILSEIIVLNTKMNDIILLVTLLVSLPTRLYKSIIVELTKN